MATFIAETQLIRFPAKRRMSQSETYDDHILKTKPAFRFALPDNIHSFYTLLTLSST